MNRASSIKTTSIAENCRTILRERCCNQQSFNYTERFGTFPQQGCPPNTWKPCYPIPTNPIYSPYGVDNLRVPVVRCEQPSYYNTTGHSSTRPPNNYIRHPSCIHRHTAPNLSISSDNCIQMITNAIITKIRYKIPREEVAVLCCCLPSLIRQILCKSPWLTPNDIIQCLSADIIKEAMNCFDQVDLNVKNEFSKPKQDYHTEENLSQQSKDNKFNDNISIKSPEDDHDSLSSYQSTTSENSHQSFSSQQSSRSVLDLPNNIPKKHSKNKKKKQRKKKNKNYSPSTRSFTSQQSKDRETGSHHSITPLSWSTEIKSKKSGRDTPVRIEDDEKSVASRNTVNSFDSNEDFDQKSIDLSPKPKSMTQLPRIHIEYPGKKDPNAVQDVEKCLAFYQKIREYFDDDVAAMLLKCCLCYGGGCSERR